MGKWALPLQAAESKGRGRLREVESGERRRDCKKQFRGRRMHMASQCQRVFSRRQGLQLDKEISKALMSTVESKDHKEGYSYLSWSQFLGTKHANAGGSKKGGDETEKEEMWKNWAMNRCQGFLSYPNPSQQGSKRPFREAWQFGDLSRDTGLDSRAPLPE